LRLACDNIYLIFEITSIDVDSEFWFPCLEIIFEKFPDVNINAGFACIKSYDISDFACCDVGFKVLSND